MFISLVEFILKVSPFAERIWKFFIGKKDHERYIYDNWGGEWGIFNEAFILVAETARDSHSTYSLEISKNSSHSLAKLLNHRFPELSSRESRKYIDEMIDQLMEWDFSSIYSKLNDIRKERRDYMESHQKSQ